MRPLSLSLPLLALAVLAAAPADAQVAADAEVAAFVTRLGDDTLAVERVRRTPTAVEATVVLRSPRTTVTEYRLDLDGPDRFRQYSAATYAPGSDVPVRREMVVPQGDSLRVRVSDGETTRERTVAGDATALPFIDMVHWPFDLMLERARRSGQASTPQPLFTERGTQPFTVGVGEGARMTVTHPFRGTMDVEADAEGRLLTLDAGSTTRKLLVVRVPDVDVDASARRFGALDAAGASFGPLSGRGEATAQIDGAAISVDYGQPAQRGRELFGALVPWGEVWRTGANRATHVQTSRDLVLGGQLMVPAGEYTLYSIPQPDGGTLIVNRQTGQGGTTYNEDQDLGRVPLTMSTLSEPVELFTIDLEDTAQGGRLRMLWGQTELSVPFTVVE